jgi:hypothetical protein
MREVLKYEFNWWQKILHHLLGMWRINRDSIDFSWGYFAPRFGLELRLMRGGYFDQRYAIGFCFIWGVFHVKLPFKTKLAEGCNLPQYGFCVSNNTAMFYWGGEFDESIGQMSKPRVKCWDLPFVSMVFETHEILSKDGGWVKVGAKGCPDSWDFRQDGALTETHKYTYTLKSGKVQEVDATCTVEQRVWHRKWLPFLKLKHKCIDISFSNEVGERSGSWKGGVTGTSYEMLPNETIEQCLRRMEHERKFS